MTDDTMAREYVVWSTGGLAAGTSQHGFEPGSPAAKPGLLPELPAVL